MFPVDDALVAERAAFDPARVWKHLDTLVVAARRRDPDAFAAGVVDLGAAPTTLQRTVARAGFALLALTVPELYGGERPHERELRALSRRLEPTARMFMRVNRWDLDEILLATFVPDVGERSDLARVAIIGAGVVGILVDALPPLNEVARNAEQYLEAVRGPTLTATAYILRPDEPRHERDEPRPRPIVDEPEPPDAMPTLP